LALNEHELASVTARLGGAEWIRLEQHA
jgi:hypothetical protein